MALNDTAVIRVHINFKKYLNGIKEESKMSFPIITKQLATERPLVVVPIRRKKKR